MAEFVATTKASELEAQEYDFPEYYDFPPFFTYVFTALLNDLDQLSFG